MGAVLNDSPPAVALRHAIELIGSQRKLAQLLGITQQSVSAWVLKRQVLPAEHVLKVEAATGVSRHDLRPDIYPIEYPPSPPAPNMGGEPGPAPFSRSDAGTPAADEMTASAAAGASQQGGGASS